MMVSPTDEALLAAQRLMKQDHLADVPGFHLPTQERTRIKTCAILAVAVQLLRTRDFAAISMNEIAMAAHCSVPSIYARFESKESLLPVVHLIVIEECRRRLDAEFTLVRYQDKTLEAFCWTLTDIVTSFFEENRNFVRAATLGESQVVHEQFHAILPICVYDLSRILGPIVGRDPAEVAPPLLQACEILVSLLRDASIVPNVAERRGRPHMARLMTMILSETFSRSA